MKKPLHVAPLPSCTIEKIKRQKIYFFCVRCEKWSRNRRPLLFPFINKRKVMGILLFFGTNVPSLGDTGKLGVGGRGGMEKSKFGRRGGKSLMEIGEGCGLEYLNFIPRWPKGVPIRINEAFFLFGGQEKQKCGIEGKKRKREFLFSSFMAVGNPINWSACSRALKRNWPWIRNKCIQLVRIWQIGGGKGKINSPWALTIRNEWMDLLRRRLERNKSFPLLSGRRRVHFSRKFL